MISFHRSMCRKVLAKQQPKVAHPGELQQPSGRQIPQDLAPSQPPMRESKPLSRDCQQQSAEQPQHPQQPVQVQQQRHFQGEYEKSLSSQDPLRQQRLGDGCSPGRLEAYLLVCVGGGGLAFAWVGGAYMEKEHDGSTEKHRWAPQKRVAVC